jgi:hypothetical protein
VLDHLAIYRVPDLLLSLVQSPAFREVGALDEEGSSP